MRVIEYLEVWGHPNITARNQMTFEFTKESHLTIAGDCIVGVKSDKGARDLSQEFIELARKPSTIRVKMVVGTQEILVVGTGSPSLSFLNSKDLVGRKSSYICDRTFIIKANKAARDFPRTLIDKMRNPLQKADITLLIEA